MAIWQLANCAYTSPLSIEMHTTDDLNVTVSDAYHNGLER
jgi:hypothetical protein